MALTTKEITKELANNYILFKRGKKSADKNISLTAKTLRRTSSMLEANHGELFANMITNISRCPDEISQSFVKVLENIFSDNVINWGRIAILFTFAGQLAVYCDRHETQEQADLVVFWLAEFVNTRLLKWIENNGGWESFNEHFKERKDETGVWWNDMLCTVGLVAGVAGAVLVFAR